MFNIYTVYLPDDTYVNLAVVPMFQKGIPFTSKQHFTCVKPSSLIKPKPKRKRSRPVLAQELRAQYFLPGFSTLQKCGIVTRQSP